MRTNDQGVDAKRIGRRIAALRTLRGLGQAQLASAAAVSSAAVSRLERGIHRPHRLTIAAIARALDIPVEDLIAAGRLHAVEGGAP